ncbi:MAG: glycosyltransferase [Prevotellaceae bacterium]|nr:glycosyltransferase [Prevotellaceae bacterium]
MRMHVVSFQVPYPPNYGGAIDVYYKLRWLREQGHDILLHTYIYGTAERQPALGELCREVHYYPRQEGLLSLLSTEPYIARSRRSPLLLRDLLRDDAPILFEGLHTCHYLSHPSLKGRMKIVRTHNIEHDYYSLLSRQVRWSWRNLYYRLEATKLRRFERVLLSADIILAISEGDAVSLRSRYPEKDIRLLPCFYDDHFVCPQGGTEPYVLYQANLRVEENARVANFIQDRLAPRMPDARFILAGRDPSFLSRRANVTVVPNPSAEAMDDLLAKARVNLLLTFQPTGVKLKLLGALSKSRGHVVANEEMLRGNDLARLCVRGEASTETLPSLLARLSQSGPSVGDIERRQRVMKEKKARVSRLKPSE